MRTQELDYELPADLIACEPLSPRDQARLMVVRRSSQQVEHRRVCDLASLLEPGDLLVVNNSRVLPAYLEGTRAATGGRVTGLYLCSDEGRWQVMFESRGTLRPGERVVLDAAAELELIERLGGGAWQVQLHSEGGTLAVLDRVGRPPLPPYIRKARRAMDLPELQSSDAQRYNTVYARDGGSVAAPTAGLHFTPGLLRQLEAMGVERAQVTLHVGLGTFAPIRTQYVEKHPIHREWMSVPGETLEKLGATRRRGGRIIAVGTTTVRALESLAPVLPQPARTVTMETDLFITPGSNGTAAFRASASSGAASGGASGGGGFRFTDGLLTNFHLPRSSLLALVAALPDVGIDRLKRYYQEAIGQRYRFYSYGDAMLLV